MLYSVLLVCTYQVFCILDLLRLKVMLRSEENGMLQVPSCHGRPTCCSVKGSATPTGGLLTSRFFRKIQRHKSYLDFSHASGLPGAGVSDDSALWNACCETLSRRTLYKGALLVSDCSLTCSGYLKPG